MSEKRSRETPRGPRGPGARHGFQKPKDLKTTVGKLLRYLAPYRFWLALVALLLVGAAVFAGSFGHPGILPPIHILLVFFLICCF